MMTPEFVKGGGGVRADALVAAGGAAVAGVLWVAVLSG